MRRPNHLEVIMKIYVFVGGEHIMTQRFMTKEHCFESVRRTLKAFYPTSEVSRKMKLFKEGKEIVCGDRSFQIVAEG